MMRWGAPRLTRATAEWEVRAVEAREVRESRWEGEEEDVMSGVRVESVRWRERSGCWAGRLVMVEEEVVVPVVLLRLGGEEDMMAWGG